jgi:hypothetical protein
MHTKAVAAYTNRTQTFVLAIIHLCHGSTPVLGVPGLGYADFA